MNRLIDQNGANIDILSGHISDIRAMLSELVDTKQLAKRIRFGQEKD